MDTSDHPENVAMTSSRHYDKFRCWRATAKPQLNCLKPTSKAKYDLSEFGQPTLRGRRDLPVCAMCWL
jgi:hypothetical protein